MDLICCQGIDRENWKQISALINKGNWDKIFILKNKNAENFEFGDNCEMVEIDSQMPLVELKREMREKLKSKIGKEFEVALSIVSGNGKEHMALISALLEMPVGIKFAAFTKNGVEFVN